MTCRTFRRLLGGATRVEVPWFTLVKRKNGRVFVRTYGARFKLTITLWAPATSSYAAYSTTKTYRLR